MSVALLNTDGVRLAFAPVTLRKLHRRDVPAEWERQLADLSPPTNRFSWLKLLWEPGDPWETPVDRFFIYQMLPAHAVEDEILEQLEHGLSPREMGNYWDPYLTWTDTDGSERIGKFVRNPDCIITQRAWELYRETKCWGRPYWVIQGSFGGHKRWFSTTEKKVLRLHNLPQEPPTPGDLPYAEFDERVICQIMKRDLLLGAQATLRRKRGLLQGIKDERYEAEERKWREEHIKWLNAQVAESAEGVAEALMKLDAPRSGMDVKAMEERQENAEANYIETGKTHGGMKLL